MGEIIIKSKTEKNQELPNPFNKIQPAFLFSQNFEG